MRHSPILPHLNVCDLARRDTERQQKEIYAYGIRYRLRHGLATKSEIKKELNARSDKQEIINILAEIKNNELQNNGNSNQK